MVRRVIALLLAMVFATFSLVGIVFGQESKAAAKKPRDVARAKRLPEVTPEREAAVLTFVKRHHPELIRLLSYLRLHQPRQYQRAVRELARMAERLAQVHQRDMARYELELRAWKTRSHIDVLVARMQVEPNDELRAELRAALVEQAATRKSLMQSERVRLVKRIEKLDAQIEQIETQQDREIEARLQALISGRRRKGSANTRRANARSDKSRSDKSRSEPKSTRQQTLRNSNKEPK